MFQELDKNGDGRLDAGEMRAALSRAGIDITPATVTDLVRFLVSGAEQKGARAGQTSASASASAAAGTTGTTGAAGTAGTTGTKSKGDMYITFPEFRDFLIMLPREATPFEIYKCESTFPAFCRAATDCATARLCLYPALSEGRVPNGAGPAGLVVRGEHEDYPTDQSMANGSVGRGCAGRLG